MVCNVSGRRDIQWLPHLTDPAAIRPTATHSAGNPRMGSWRCMNEQHGNFNQMLFFNALTGNAFTMVLAGFAFTICILPKISRFPALVAGLVRVLILQRPGTVKRPAFFTSAVAIVARLSRSFVHWDFFTSVPVANASASAPLVMALVVAFMDGAMLQNAMKLRSAIAGKTAFG